MTYLTDAENERRAKVLKGRTYSEAARILGMTPGGVLLWADNHRDLVPFRRRSWHRRPMSVEQRAEKLGCSISHRTERVAQQAARWVGRLKDPAPFTIGEARQWSEFQEEARTWGVGLYDFCVITVKQDPVTGQSVEQVTHAEQWQRPEIIERVEGLAKKALSISTDPDDILTDPKFLQRLMESDFE